MTRRDRVRHLIVPVALIAAALGALALASAPNNYDSMTYHMSRVAHWIQNRGVAHYPTHIIRQLYLGPWAEYAILHLQLLSGGDRWANLVQWAAMAGSVLGVSWIARQLGAGPWGQVFAAVVAVSLPMGLLQATSTQTDYVAAFWMVCLASFVLSAVETTGEGIDPSTTLAAGATLGLALLTKGTSYVFTAPFVLWLGVALLVRHRRKAAQTLVVTAAVALALNASLYWRNVQVFASPLGPDRDSATGHRFANRPFSLGAAASNVVRNLALELGTPSAPANGAIEAGVRHLHRWLGLDPDDPRTTFGDESFGIRASLWNSENVAGNPVHTLLVLAALATILVARWPTRRLVLTYAAALLLASLLFCFYLTWAPWHTRLHLPVLVLWSPVVGIAMSQSWSRPVATTVAAGLLPLTIPWLVNTAGHPLVGPFDVRRLPRRDQYFIRAPSFRDPYVQIAALAHERRCERIGLVIGRDDYEYPLWVLARERLPALRIEHVDVTNASAKTAYTAGFTPCLVVTIDARRRLTVEVRE